MDKDISSLSYTVLGDYQPKKALHWGEISLNH